MVLAMLLAALSSKLFRIAISSLARRGSLAFSLAFDLFRPLGQFLDLRHQSSMIAC